MKISLQKKVVLSAAVMALALSAAAGVVSYRVYSDTMNTHYENLSHNIAHATAAMVDGDAVAELAQLTLDAYRTQCPDAETAPDFESFTQADWVRYYAAFDAVTESEAYRAVSDELAAMKEENDVQSLYLCYLDTQTGKGIYIIDASDPGSACYTGTCDDLTAENTARIAAGDYEFPAYITNTEEYGWLSSSATGVNNAQGQTVASIFVDISMNDVMQDRQDFLFSLLLVLGGVTLAVMAVMSLGISRTVVRPINRLAKAAGDFAANKQNGVEGAVMADLDIRTGDEIENLAATFKTMEEELNSYITNLAAVTAEKERIGAELNVAATIQADMLPCVFPPFPDRHEFDIYATMTPAKEVGGDFYDFFLIDDDHLALVMADVSGKGVPAALFMMISKTLLKSAAQTGLSPAAILHTVNDQLCENNDAEMFVTVWLGILQISTGRMVCANAGHEFPAVQRHGGPFELLKDRHGFVLAGMPGSKYREYTLELGPGDALFVYTDGVPEATNAQNTLYGTDRMIAALNRAPGADSAAVLRAVHEDVNTFVGSAPQFDDITMLCIRMADTAAAGGETQTLTLAPHTEDVARVTDFCESMLTQAGAPMKIVAKVNIAVDEIFSNIARYSGAATADIACTVTENSVRLCFSDDGRPYDPTQTPEPDTTLSAEDRAIGGLGIHMVRKMMDAVTYEYSGGRNRLTLEKRW